MKCWALNFVALFQKCLIHLFLIFYSFFNPDFSHLSFSVVLYFSSSSVLLSLTVAVIFSVHVRFFPFSLLSLTLTLNSSVNITCIRYIYSICIFFYIKRNITIWSCSLMVSVAFFFCRTNTLKLFMERNIFVQEVL